MSDKTRKEQPMPQAQPVSETDLPLADELGFETVEFSCWKCQRASYMSKDAAELIRARGTQLFCLPCSRPDLFKWIKDRREGSSGEIIQPLDGKQRKKRQIPGDKEAEELARRRHNAQLLEDRQKALLQIITDARNEYARLEATLMKERQELVGLQHTVEALFIKDDDQRQARMKYDRIREQVARLTDELRKAGKIQ